MTDGSKRVNQVPTRRVTLANTYNRMDTNVPIKI